MNRHLHRLCRLGLAAVTFAAASGCASGESIINAGNDGTRSTTTGVPAVSPGATIPLGGTVPLTPTTIPLGATVPLGPTTTPLVPTTPAVGATIPLPTVAGPSGFAGRARPAAPADIAPCPVQALDEADGPVEITFWHAMGAANEEALIALTEEYNQSQDRVRVTLENQTGYGELVSKYFVSSPSDRPHLVQMPEYMTQPMADANGVIPVGACIQAEGYDIEPYVDRALLAYQTGGIQWSMPFNVSSPVLFYNRQHFDAAGLDPDSPPISLDQVREYSEAIVESDAASYGIVVDSGVNSGGGWFLEQWMARLGLPYTDNNNGRSGRATEVLFDTPAVVELLTEVQAMVDEGLAFNVGDAATPEIVLLPLADPNQPVAMAIATSASLGTVFAFVEGGLIPGVELDDIGVGPMPGPTDTPGAIVGGASLYISRDLGDAEAAASWDFIKFVTSAQAQSTWAHDTGYVPVREDAVELEPLASVYGDDPRTRVAFDQLTVEGDDLNAVGPMLGPLQEIREVTARMMATIFDGGDVADAVTAAADQANALIADYNARN